jgi:uncharacterized membrane protein
MIKYLMVLMSVMLVSCFTTTTVKDAKRSDDKEVKGKASKLAPASGPRWEVINGVFMLVEDVDWMRRYDSTITNAQRVEAEYKNAKGNLDTCTTEMSSKKLGGTGGMPSNYGTKDIFAKNEDFTKIVTIEYEDGSVGVRELTDWKKKSDRADEILKELLGLRDTSRKEFATCEANLKILKEEHELVNNK